MEEAQAGGATPLGLSLEAVNQAPQCLAMPRSMAEAAQALVTGRQVTHLGGLVAEPPQQQHHHVHSSSSHLSLGVCSGYGCQARGDLWGQGSGGHWKRQGDTAGLDRAAGQGGGDIPGGEEEGIPVPNLGAAAWSPAST